MSETEEVEQKKPHEPGLVEEFLGDFISFDRGFPATITGMFKNPAKIIESYFEEKGRFVSPFRYVILILAVTTFFTSLVIDYDEIMHAAIMEGSGRDLEEMQPSLEAFKEKTGFDMSLFLETVQEVSVAISTKFNQLFYILVLAPLLAFTSRLFFKDRKSQYKNHYVMFLYTLASLAILSLILTPIVFLGSSFWIYSLTIFVVQMGYTMFVQSRYFKLKGWEEYFQSGLSFIFGYVLFLVATFVIQFGGGLILYFIKS